MKDTTIKKKIREVFKKPPFDFSFRFHLYKAKILDLPKDPKCESCR